MTTTPAPKKPVGLALAKPEKPVNEMSLQERKAFATAIVEKLQEMRSP